MKSTFFTVLAFTFAFTWAEPSFADDPILRVTVQDISAEYQNVDFSALAPTPTPTSIGQKIDIGQIIEIGSKIWNFILNNKPNAVYNTLKTSVVPGGITNWTQLTGWKMANQVSKVYRVQFKDIFGGSAGGFDYRIAYFFGGTYQGKGKYIGELTFTPLNIQLHTDRSLTLKAELLDVLNFGTEDSPIPGVQMQITWSSPTTTRYTMSSAEYMIYGSGEIQSLSNNIGQ